jgi:hypothetical protein
LKTAIVMEIIVAPVVSHAFVVPSRFDVQHHEIDIKIRQGATPGGMLHTGALVWVGSRLMGEWLATGYGLIPEIAGVSDEMQSTQQHPLAGKSVLELGCGVSAIPSLVAHHCGAKTVVSADLPDECDLLKINVQSCTRSAPEPAEAVDAPRVLCACDVSRTPSPLSCALCRREMFIRPFDWSKDDVKVVFEPVERYDCVLAAETLYEGTWEPQSRLIYTMLRPADAGE